MPKCEICGKTRAVGHRVSHSNIKNKRDWSPNVQRVRVAIQYSEKDVGVH